MGLSNDPLYPRRAPAARGRGSLLVLGRLPARDPRGVDPLGVEEDEDLRRGRHRPRDAQEARLGLQDPGVDAGGDQQGLAELPAVEGLVEPGLGDFRHVELHLVAAGLAPGEDLGSVQLLDGVGLQVDGDLQGVALIRQKRAHPQGDPLGELGRGLLDAQADGRVSLGPDDVIDRRDALDGDGLAVDDAELLVLDQEARKKQKDAFTKEAKDWFEQDIINLKDYKTDNLGVRHTSPDFVYSSTFNLEGLVKKAGNNIIIEIGKIQGQPLVVKQEQRKRAIDIYMPFARSIDYNIELQIPDGYSAEGIAALNKKVETEAGYFIAEANTTDKTVTIKIKKHYLHNFELAKNWDNMMLFMDAANEWVNAKLLLKKK